MVINMKKEQTVQRLNALKRYLYDKIKMASLRSAIKSQGLHTLFCKLTSIAPDIGDQYTNSEIESDFWVTKVRALHSFQISLVEKAIKRLTVVHNNKLALVDIGDSSGTHALYLRSLYDNISILSVNLDAEAVAKIRKKGLDAIHARAEDIESYSIKADIYMSFEMLEHLSDPAQFLHKLSKNTQCGAFVISVPYLEKSRIGLHHIRKSIFKPHFAENTHLFELSPTDWQLIFKHAGWSVYFDQIYFQYPKCHYLRILKQYWKNNDYEGFYGAILIKDTTYSDLYKDW